jgi:DNA-binding NarL/FixJ family response regulator
VPEPVRILLADDHAMVRAGVRLLLSRLPDVEVVGEAGDGARALELIAERHPDVALIDVSMPGLDGIETARRALRLHPGLRVIMLSMYGDGRYVREALALGAAGYVLKQADEMELQQALDATTRGETYLSPGLSRDGDAPGESPPQVAQLTPRQRDVLRLIAEGHSTRDVAARLGVSPKTVETHRALLMRRLGIHNVPGLVRFAIRAGLVTVEE